MIYIHHCGQKIIITSGALQWHFWDKPVNGLNEKLTHCPNPKCGRYLFQTDVNTSLLKPVEEKPFVAYATIPSPKQPIKCKLK